MRVSAMLTSLPMEFEPAIQQIAQMGFSHIDIVALAQRPESHLNALAESGLIVSCASIGRGLPEGQTLEAPALADRKQAVEMMQKQITDAAQLGATHCYLVPGFDQSNLGLIRFADGCAALANFASSRMVQLCIEHFPKRTLPSVKATLKWLEQNQLDNVQLLLDVGHCLISEEDPSQAVVEAGPRLGYVHFNDNDSVEDLHWPLLTGRLTMDMVDALVAILRLSNYRGSLALELNPKNADPVKALQDGKAILEKALT